MKLSVLSGILFFGDLFACNPRENGTPGNTMARTDRDGYISYNVDGIPVHNDLNEGLTVVGSSCRADCFVRGKNISGRHLVIRRRGNQYFVMNVSGRGKTYVGDRELKKGEEEPIESGSTIRLGDVLIRFMRRPHAPPGILHGF